MHREADEATVLISNRPQTEDETRRRRKGHRWLRQYIGIQNGSISISADMAERFYWQKRACCVRTPS